MTYLGRIHRKAVKSNSMILEPALVISEVILDAIRQITTIDSGVALGVGLGFTRGRIG